MVKKLPMWKLSHNDKIATTVSQSNRETDSQAEEKSIKIAKERCISPEKRPEIIDELRLI